MWKAPVSRHKNTADKASPYTHLLKTKAGGIAFVLAAMGEQLNTILDVTIAYPGKPGSFWDFLCGKFRNIKVEVRSMPIDPSLVGNYALDHCFSEPISNLAEPVVGGKG